jgi:hypothetical protein
MYILIRALVGFIRALKEDPLPLGMFGVLHEKEKYHVSVIESTPTKTYIIIEREILHSNWKKLIRTNNMSSTGASKYVALQDKRMGGLITFLK